MTFAAIPAWDHHGVLPPLNTLSPTSADRSPYVVSLTDLVMRFSTSDERRRILDGLRRYRQEFHRIGLTSGFQWLDGSFLEQIELREDRAPRDIDVVTFFDMPVGRSQIDVFNMNPRFFRPDDRENVKNDFHVDGQWVSLSVPPRMLVGRAAYWYSIWAHRRDHLWKGFVQIDLSPLEDATAWANLNSPGAGGHS